MQLLLVVEEEEEDFMISRSAWTPQRRVTEKEVEVAPFADLTNKKVKPLSSARFGRKAAKPNPEGNNNSPALLFSSQTILLMSES